MTSDRVLRLLVADDSALVRHRYAVMLDGERHVAIVASVGSAAECLTAVRVFRPDVAIVDAELSGAQGWAVSRAIAASSSPVPVVLVARDAEGASPTAVVEAIEAGAITIVPRPTMETLLDERARKAFVAMLWRAAAQG